MKLLHSHNDIEYRIKNIVDIINNDYKDKNPIFIIIMDGAYRFFDTIKKFLTIQYDNIYIKATTLNNERFISKIQLDLNNKNIIIVDDIIVSGNTLYKLSKFIKNNYQNVDIEYCSLIYQSETLIYEVTPKYFIYKEPPLFYIGFGLDVNGFGREYNDIYIL